MHDRWRHSALGWWSRIVSRYPRWVLGCGILLAIAPIVFAATSLGFQGDRNDLLSHKLSWNKLYLEWNEQFTARDDLVVAIDLAESPGLSEAEQRAIADETGQALGDSPLVREVLWRVDTADFHPRAARLQSIADYRAQLQQAADAQPLLASETPTALIARITRDLQAAQQSPPEADAANDVAEQAAPALHQLAALLDAINTSLQQDAGDTANPFARISQAPAAADDANAAPDYRYFHNNSRDLYYLRVSPIASEGNINPFLPAIQDVRAILATVSERHPGITMGVTGVKVIEADETLAATRDSTIASIVAAILIAALLITAFHSIRTPVLGLIALGLAIAWTFGFATLAIGHLQVLSVVFTLILLGLGIDFAVHLTTRLELVRHDYPDTTEGFSDALTDTLETTGPGVVTGAITTAVAFAMTLVTDFQGVREMGMIAGAGVLLCLLSMVTMLPALQRRWGRRYRHVRPMSERKLHLFDGRWLGPIERHPRLTLGIAAVLALLSAFAVTQMRYDFNLLKLQASSGGVIWMNKLADRSDQGTFYGISMADSLEEARRRARQFLALPNVASVGGIGLLVPDNDQQKQQLAADARDALGQALPDAVNHNGQTTDAVPLGQYQTQLRILQIGLSRELPAETPQPIRDAIARVRASVTQLLATLDAVPLDQSDASADRVAAQYNAWRTSLATQLDQLTDGQPLQVGDVPAALVAPSLGADGRYAIEVYPHLATDSDGQRIEAPLDPAVMARFAEDVLTVDPDMTGPMLQIYRSGILMREAYKKAGLLALLAVFILVWLDFRSLHDAVLTLAPVALGFGVTFGLMWCLGMTLNPANIIVLPLMFGIGVDAGVHLIHRYNQHSTDPPPGLSHGTGKGIVVTGLTTMIAFGVMIPANHQGIASLGSVLTLGIGMTLLACLTVMPAYLTLRNEWRAKRAAA